MPRIPGTFLHSVVFLYPTRFAAEQGEQAGGSGFLVGVPQSRERVTGVLKTISGLKHAKSVGVWNLYAVTARHVILEARSPVVRVNTLKGSTEAIELQEQDWILHPDGDDVAVCPIGLSPQLHLQSFIPDMFFVDEREPWQFGPGDDVFFVGRFIGHDGHIRNTPSVRFGNISMMPERVRDEERGLTQYSFLVEARSLPGYSGSPVFVYEPTIEVDSRWDESEAELIPVSTARLLGLDWCHFPSMGRVFDGPTPIDQWTVRQNSGMMGVVPAWKIAETLAVDELVELRHRAEREWQERATGVDLDAAQEPEYGREDFMRDRREIAQTRMRNGSVEDGR